MSCTFGRIKKNAEALLKGTIHGEDGFESRMNEKNDVNPGRVKVFESGMSCTTLNVICDRRGSLVLGVFV